MHSTQPREATIRYPEKLRLRTPRGLSAALEQAAGRNHTSPSEWARQAQPQVAPIRLPQPFIMISALSKSARARWPTK